MTNKYLEGLIKENNYTLTENVAKTYKSTLSKLLDFFGTCGALRTRTEDEITKKFLQAFSENRLYAMKSLFYCRDVRGGQGERRTPKIIFRWMAEYYPDILGKNLHLIPEFGRWDDLFVLKGTKLEDKMFGLVKEQLLHDVGAENPSLLAKWMPSENTKSNNKTRKELALWFIMKLGHSKKSYRKMLSKLRKKIGVIEQIMCHNEWSAINYEHIPSKASSLYRSAFGRHDPDGYKAYLDSVEKGEKKINTGAIFPYEIIRPLWGYNSKNDRTLDLQWKNLPNYIPKGENAIVVADTSGSMSGLPIQVCISLAMYFAERNEGPWKDHFITFSRRPTLQKIVGKDLWEKVRNLNNADWDMNTNLQSVFNLLLRTAISYSLEPSDMLKKIYIVSDMEFDSCIRDGNMTNFRMMETKYQEAGYELPTVVFWNVNSRNDQQPITIDEKGVYLVSGCSPSIFKSIMESKTITPLDLMLEVLDKDRYACITI